MDAEVGIVATLVQSSIGSTPGTVLSLVAGYDPVASLEGENPLFTYTFDDGSGLVLVVRPAGGLGTGLVLDDIDDQGSARAGAREGPLRQVPPAGPGGLMLRHRRAHQFW